MGKRIAMAAALAVSLAAGSAAAHEKRTDACGCHHQYGSRHCHPKKKKTHCEAPVKYSPKAGEREGDARLTAGLQT